MDRITHFRYEHDFLSNFPDAPVRLDGVAYRSVEHAYQAAKVADLTKREIFTLDFNPNLTAGQAKRLGGNIVLRENWDNIRIPIMRGLLLQKFGQEALGRKLLATGDAHLEEGNHWHDVFWGVCHHKLEGKTCREPEHEPFGENMLGKLLMEIRAFYRGLNITRASI